MATHNLVADIAFHMADQGVSKRELARRLASTGGREPAERQWAAQRRWVQKLLGGELKRPTQTKLDQVAAALGLPPGTFVVPHENVVSITQPDGDRLQRVEDTLGLILDRIDQISERLGRQAPPVPGQEQQENS